MMKKQLNTNNIRQKFISLMNIDEQYHQKYLQQRLIFQARQNNLKKGKQIVSKAFDQNQKDEAKNSFENRFKQIIYTKSDIVKQISKLKPYLNEQKEELTTVQAQNLENKKMTADQKRKLSNVVIYLNKRLCQKLQQQANLQKQFQSDRIKRQRQGWIYQVFFRHSPNIKAELSNTVFKNGYVVLTTIIQLYQNLTFDNRIIKFNVSQIKRVKYTTEKQYQVIDIRYEGGTFQVAFLSDIKMQMFDRMLFLLKNMARTSTSRLFQNQLIKSLYSQY